MRVDNGDNENVTDEDETRGETVDHLDDLDRRESLGQLDNVTDETVTGTVLTTEQSDTVDMIRGRINSGLVGFDADSRLTILETVRSVLNQMIDDVISELTDDDETDNGDDYEVSTCDNCGKVEHSEAELAECVASAIGPPRNEDDEDGEHEPVTRCPACGEPSDYCLGHGETGDPSGFAVLAAHDNGDHSQCADVVDCHGLAD